MSTDFDKAGKAGFKISARVNGSFTDPVKDAFLDINLREMKNSSNYAYSWLISSIHEDKPAYKGFLYDVFISVNLLKGLGSQADFVLWYQLSPESKLGSLPKEDAELLDKLGIRTLQLKKPKYESFAHLVFDKFRIFQMVQYRRVIFMDADTIPLVNMDYLFHLSDPEDHSTLTVLRPNLVMASRGEPCNTGVFMVKPDVRNWIKLQEVINKQHELGRKLPYPHFDKYNGWGHNFWEAGDKWESVIEQSKRDTKRWRFHAGHSDQGLFYYFTKYVLQDVSIVIGTRVQAWGPGREDGGPPKKISEINGLLKFPTSVPLAYQDECDNPSNLGMRCFAPYNSFAHFMGETKPWQVGVEVQYMKRQTSRHTYAASRLWFKELAKLNKKYKMGLDIENWNSVHLREMKKSPLGYMATYKDHTLKLKEGGDLKLEIKEGGDLKPNKGKRKVLSVQDFHTRFNTTQSNHTNSRPVI
eukprot:CAMPEP_0194341362 /NCGR_PEP_ID=MMETSP0171-20130528/89453_1 /TAXON_ID=218684 /ORGANISM="Corethron pennatum, Strain L29A3" /LENGTH=469 /DNA_ID=CAMNT_0039106677 /DNA_START=524 /DNA_END=1930 /DNA_ORIENTATION=+